MAQCGPRIAALPDGASDRFVTVVGQQGMMVPVDGIAATASARYIARKFGLADMMRRAEAVTCFGRVPRECTILMQGPMQK